MKKFGFIILVFVATIYLFGCGKKQQSLEEMQQPMSMETITTINASGSFVPVASEVKAPEVKTTAPIVSATQAAKLEPLPPTGPFKPSGIDIQTALKHAGFYEGKIDGKIGPMSKKAITEFQKANNLPADGKVGPKTWAALSKHLNPEPAIQTTR